MHTPTLPKTIYQQLHRLLIAPRQTDPDRRRHEYILNVLLVALATGASIAMLILIVHLVTIGVAIGSIQPTLVFTVLIYGMLLLSRTKHSKLASYLFLALLGLAATQLLLEWSFELPQTSLAFILMVVVAGVLLSARATLYFAGLAMSLIIIIGRQQTLNHLHPDLSWLKESFTIGDAISYGVVIAIIGVVSWLSNREIDGSLRRARASEAALALERDSLEIKVAERTHDLEQAQYLRTIELKRFAEFGQHNANLLHEISNPLTAASLNLALMEGTNSQLVSQARDSLKQMERYVTATRRQLRSESEHSKFDVSQELQKAVSAIKQRADLLKVNLELHAGAKLYLYGDSIKFNQIISNLLRNSLDAFSEATQTDVTRIVVTASQTAQWLTISVEDTAGGIEAAKLSKIFEPFYTTKQLATSGLGIGLAMARQFVEDDFGGSLSVASQPKQGSTFTVKLKRTAPK